MWKPPVTYRLLKKIFPVLAVLIILFATFATVFPTTAQIPPLACNISQPYCVSGMSRQVYQITCPTTVNLITDASAVIEPRVGTFFQGIELLYQNTNIVACVPNTSNCNVFNTSANPKQTCLVVPPPPLKNCNSCDATGRSCVTVPGGYKCVGLIQ